MKKALACTLSLALLLSLTACHKPQAEQPNASQPDNSATTSTQADVSIPEADNAPETEPPKATVPEQLSDTTPTVPAENEDTQDQAEPAAQEPAETEPVSEPVKTETPKQTAPKTTDNPPAQPAPEPQPAQPEPEPQSSGRQLTIDDFITHPDKNKSTQQDAAPPAPPSGGGTSMDEILKANPGAYIDENGDLHLPHLDDYKSVSLS